jgi:hypothetical protein
VALYEITVIDAPWQRLDTYLSDTAVALELQWNETANRWSMSLEIEGVMRLQGRRLVPGVDLIAPYNLGIGSLYLVDWDAKGGSPGRDALPAGQFRLIHDDGLPEAA